MILGIEINLRHLEKLNSTNFCFHEFFSLDKLFSFFFFLFVFVEKDIVKRLDVALNGWWEHFDMKKQHSTQNLKKLFEIFIETKKQKKIRPSSGYI